MIISHHKYINESVFLIDDRHLKGYTPSENFLALSVSPPDASVQVDGKTLFDESNGKGQYQPLLPIGKHTYEISNDMYHTAKGEFVISPDSTETLDISLKPNFGYIKVNSTPEAAATVRINNSSAGKTPYTSDRLRSGVYTVSVFKAMYQSATQEVSVTDGETSAVTLAMTPDFAEPVITCSDPNAEIFKSLPPHLPPTSTLTDKKLEPHLNF